MTREESSSAAKSIRDLISDLGLPSRLRDVNVRPEDFPFLAKDALEDLVVATNPRPVGSVEDVIELLQSAW